LGINTDASAKSIEKLSSGYRINRAGDDAAGLAISEKMRAQIRGLDQASRNSQDAISLVQTAEGALNESQAILQRMRELAVQSANDTNETEDRDAIQSEIDQLTSELNRISETTEFNKKTLLDGSLAITGDGLALKAGATLSAGVTAVNIDVDGSVATGIYDVEITSDTVAKIESTVLSDVTDASVTAGDVVDLAGGAYKIAITAEDTKQLTAAGYTDADSILNDDNNNTPITLEANSSLNDVEHTLTVDKAQTVSVIGSGLEVTTGQLNNIDSGTYTITTERTFDDAATDVTDSVGAAGGAVFDGVISNFGVADGATAAEVAAINTGAAGINTISISVSDTVGDVATITFDDGTNSVSITPSAAGNGAQTIKLGAISFDVDVDAILDGVTFGDGTADTGTYDGQTITIAANAIHDQVTVSDGINSATASVASGSAATTDLTFDLDGGGNDFFLTVTAADFVQDNTINATVQSEYTVSLKETVSGTQIGVATTIDQLDIASNPNALNNLAFGGSGVQIDLSAATLASMSTGAHTATFTVETAAGYTAELQKADGTAVDGAKYALNDAAVDDTTIDLGRDVVLTYDGTDLSGDGAVYFGVNANVTEYTIELTNDGGTVSYGTVTGEAGDTFDFGNGVTIDTDAATLANSAATTFEIENTEVDNSIQMQIGANTDQSIAISIGDMGASSLGVSSTTTGAVTGFANASYNATKSVEADGTTEAEYSLDVSSYDSATAAIEVIDNALTTISDQRAKLGAVQNRLEHTIKNLDTSSENLSASESRIRDVDMAKEMMEYTKNNILQQAAQAMLAQANQAPQGVLQLLR
jgi:flagellin